MYEMRRIARAGWLGLLLVLSGCAAGSGCQDTNIANAQPQIAVNPTSLSYGSVSLMSVHSAPIEVSNTGTGWLEFEEITVVDDAGGAFWCSQTPQAISSSEPWVLQVAFAPIEDEDHSGILRLASNSIEDTVLDIPLDGLGYRPVLDIDPDTLYYDTAEGSEAETQVVVLESTGTGPVALQEVFIDGDEEGAFSVELPASVDTPYQLEVGLSIELQVHHDPVIGEDYEATLQVLSDDLNDEVQVVDLVAGDGGSSGSEPVVEITEPNNGFALEVGSLLDLAGTVYDADQSSDTLVIYFYSSIQGNLGMVDDSDGDGNVSLADVELELGAHTISLFAQDNDLNVGSDSISALVWEEGQTFDYVISGGDTIYHYFAVDDDITIYLNGSPIYVDADGGDNQHAPIPLEAAPGDTLRIVATDNIAWNRVLEGLFLHLNEGNIQTLNDPYAGSGVEGDPNYDANYDIDELPYVFLDEEYVISIP